MMLQLLAGPYQIYQTLCLIFLDFSVMVKNTEHLCYMSSVIESLSNAIPAVFCTDEVASRVPGRHQDFRVSVLHHCRNHDGRPRRTFNTNLNKAQHYNPITVLFICSLTDITLLDQRIFMVFPEVDVINFTSL